MCIYMWIVYFVHELISCRRTSILYHTLLDRLNGAAIEHFLSLFINGRTEF